MNGKDVFVVAVRIIGIWEIARAITGPTWVEYGPTPGVILAAIVSGIVGLILFFGANGFVRTAYHREL